MRRIFCVLGVCLLGACSRQETAAIAATPTPAATPQPRLLVLATIAPMYCFTKNVVGGLADVEMIVPPDAKARGFAPSPEEVKRIAQADVIVENGFGFEDWMDRIEASGGLKPGAIRVIAARGTGPGIPGLPGDPDSPPAGAPPDMTGPPDPHVWLDPIMAIKEVQNIRDALMARDPAHANNYLANENQYEAALRELDDSVGRLTVDLKKRNVTGVDSTFNYFLSRYELAGDASKKAPADVLAGTADSAARLNTSRMAVVLLDPMENGPASTDDYETRTSANMQKLCKALSQ